MACEYDRKLAMSDIETVMNSAELREKRRFAVDPHVDPSGAILMFAHLRCPREVARTSHQSTTRRARAATVMSDFSALGKQGAKAAREKRGDSE
jgi:hypothetical protein